MALPTSYLTSTKKLDAILDALQKAQAPPKLTISFLEDLGFKSNSDRLVINVFKALGLLAPDGSPTERYFRFLDEKESGRVLAEGLRDAYADLFQLHKDAQSLPRNDIKNKFKTLTQGKASDAVLDKMAMTFLALAKKADFTGTPQVQVGAEGEAPSADPSDAPPQAVAAPAVSLGGLVYNIQIHLPESRDQAVYDALFRSLTTHLLK
jgi:hypothetical protein